MARVIVVVVSDTHGGHLHGLLNPETELEKEDANGNMVRYHPALTEPQKHLWNLYERFMGEVVRLAGRDELVVWHNGDVNQGTKFPEQLVSVELHDQIAIGAWNLVPWLRIKQVRKRLGMVAGTGSHEFGAGSGAYLVAQALRGMVSGAEIETVFHALADYEGFTVDIAHHGPHPGMRIWTSGNVARLTLQSMMLEEIAEGRKPPDLVVRSHYHTPVLVWNRVGGYESRLYITASMAMPGAWTRQATRSAPKVVNGFMAAEIVDGRLVKVHEFLEGVDLRRRVKWEGRKRKIKGKG